MMVPQITRHHFVCYQLNDRLEITITNVTIWLHCALIGVINYKPVLLRKFLSDNVATRDCQINE